MIKDHAYGGLYKQSLGKKDHNLNVWSEMNVHTFFDFSIKYFFYVKSHMVLRKIVNFLS